MTRALSKRLSAIEDKRGNSMVLLFARGQAYDLAKQAHEAAHGQIPAGALIVFLPHDADEAL